MKKCRLHLVSIVLLILLVSGCQKPTFHDSNGGVIYKSDLDEKWLIVNYWATWCAPCIAEIPELNELAETHKDKLILMGVNYDQPNAEEMAKQIKKMKIKFPVFATEPSKRLGVQLPEVLPTTFVFKPGGELVKILVGPQTLESLLKVLDAE